MPNDTGWYGRWRLRANEDNDWQIDRAAQRAGQSFTGIGNIHLQDQAVTESMGPIIDHEFEHLGPSDRMIALTRRRLLTGGTRLARRARRAAGCRRRRTVPQCAQRLFPLRGRPRLARSLCAAGRDGGTPGANAAGGEVRDGRAR